jgi:hypothetical protein
VVVFVSANGKGVPIEDAKKPKIAHGPDNGRHNVESHGLGGMDEQRRPLPGIETALCRQEKLQVEDDREKGQDVHPEPETECVSRGVCKAAEFATGAPGRDAMRAGHHQKEKFRREHGQSCYLQSD